MDKIHYSSERTDWATPPEIFQPINQVFNFTLDVCATAENTTCTKFFSPENDGLTQSWAGEICWMNPPYGTAIGGWVQKAAEEAVKGATVVALLPARTDTKWWHSYVMKAEAIWLVKGRIRFVGAKASAPFPSAVALFNSANAGQPELRQWNPKTGAFSMAMS